MVDSYCRRDDSPTLADMSQTIVVIEDQEEVRENLVETLELDGYSVHAAADGHAGVRAVREHSPQLVLCDVMMPRLDGYGVLKLLRDDDATRHIPLVFLTARAEREDLRRGMNLGAADYVTKPYFQDELLNVVKQRVLPEGGQPVATAASDRAPDAPNWGGSPERLAEVLDGLQARGRERAYGDRAPIHFRGDPTRAVGRVVEGRVRLYRETTFDKVLTVDSVGPGGWYGIDDVLAGGAHGLSAAAHPRAVVAVVDAAEVRDALRHHPELWWWLGGQLAQDLALRAEQLVQIAYYSVRKRVAEYLLRTTSAEGGPDARVELRREDIAEAVGTTPESVTRVLTEFRRDGLVALPNPGEIVLERRGGLEAVPA